MSGDKILELEQYQDGTDQMNYYDVFDDIDEYAETIVY